MNPLRLEIPTYGNAYRKLSTVLEATEPAPFNMWDYTSIVELNCGTTVAEYSTALAAAKTFIEASGGLWNGTRRLLQRCTGNLTDQPYIAPSIISLGSPVTIDEDAEVVTGGLLSAIIAIPTVRGYTLLGATRADFLRNGAMAYLIDVLVSSNCSGSIDYSITLGPNNMRAMHLMVEKAFIPGASRGGAVEWTRTH